LAIIGFSLLLFFITVAVFAPYIAPPKYTHNPYLMPHKGYSQTPKPPSKQNIFGTTSGQYDIFYGAVWGTRTAFKIGLFVVCIAACIGVILGVISGYYGGIVDELLMRFVDIVFAIPLLVLTMAIVVAFGRGLDKVMIALAMVGWRSYVRVMRSSILTLRQLDFVQAARVMGVSNIKIMLRHILPNGIYPVLVMAFMDIGSMVVVAAFMSFVGLGAPKGYADWGQMVALARNYIVGPPDDPLRYWYAIVIPGGCIVLFVLAWNLIGDALRDAFDPKIRRG
jgi:peptide/nickel transport system permease protein